MVIFRFTSIFAGKSQSLWVLSLLQSDIEVLGVEIDRVGRNGDEQTRTPPAKVRYGN